MEFAEQLKGVVRIEDVVGEYVRLRKSGPSRYMGLCPFHSEKTPSFTVHVVHQFYKCFSCGAGGDVIKFVMEKEGLSFFEALKSLAERYGIPMPKRSQYADEDSRMRGALFEMHELAAQANFRANLQSPAGDAARAYLARRGVSAGDRRAIRPGIFGPFRPRAGRGCSSERQISPRSRRSSPAWWASGRTAASTTVSATA